MSKFPGDDDNDGVGGPAHSLQTTAQCIHKSKIRILPLHVGEKWALNSKSALPKGY